VDYFEKANEPARLLDRIDRAVAEQRARAAPERADLLTAPGAVRGERAHVTVLFADLRRSLELLASRDLDEARAIVDGVLVRMMDAVHRHRGAVNQVMGDGIMAIFGAPVAAPDHAVNACAAAAEMQAMVRRYSAELRAARGVEVQIRVGLASGDVVLRSIGSDLRRDYTAVGLTTHLAARMEQAAEPGTALMTADTARLAGGAVSARPSGQIAVRGLPGTVVAWELLTTTLRPAPSPTTPP
jgi:class 3 adenylate cyclase